MSSALSLTLSLMMKFRPAAKRCRPVVGGGRRERGGDLYLGGGNLSRGGDLQQCIAHLCYENKGAAHFQVGPM